MPSMTPCPKCGEYVFHKSHTKNSFEKARKRFFRQQPYRCHGCGYRGWVARTVIKQRITFKQVLLYLGVFVIAVIVSLLIKNFLS